MQKRWQELRNRQGSFNLPRPALLALPRHPMHRRERIVNNYLSERLRRIRREQRISLADLAERIGLPIQDIWFPVHERIECVDTAVIRYLLQRISEQSREVTEEDVIEIAASVFQVPVHAITEGFQHRKIVQARTAAVFAVESHPLLKRSRLARLVRRTSETLKKSRCKAEKYGPDFWRKVEAVQMEVDSL